jgi:hypothetical protein
MNAGWSPTSNSLASYGGPSSLRGGVSFGSFLGAALASDNGGHWSNGNGFLFTSNTQALVAGIDYQNRHNSWGNTQYGSAAASEFAYTWTKVTGSMPVVETVNYWMNERERVLSGGNHVLTSSNSIGIDVNDALGVLKKDAYLALRVALHLPDAFAVYGNINAITIYGTDWVPSLSPTVTTSYFGVLTGPDAGKSTTFREITHAFGWDISAGVAITEFYHRANGNVPHRIGDFQGFRKSLNVGVGILGYDTSMGISWANVDSGMIIGISRFVGVGDPGPSFGFNWGRTIFDR